MKYKILIIFVFMFFFMVGKSYAQEFTVTGVVTDESQNPMPASTLEFKNANGESVGSTQTTYDGSYEIQVDEDTYTVKIEGPDGSGIGSVEYESQIISGDTKLDYILELEDLESSSIINSNNYKVLAIGSLVFVVILLGIVYIYKRKR